MVLLMCFVCNDTATTQIYTYRHTLSLHDALPIYGDAITPRLRITSSACGPCAHCDPALAVLARSPTQSERSCWVSNQAPNVTLSSVSAEQESIAVTVPLPCRQAAIDR